MDCDFTTATPIRWNPKCTSYTMYFINRASPIFSAGCFATIRRRARTDHDAMGMPPPPKFGGAPIHEYTTELFRSAPLQPRGERLPLAADGWSALAYAKDYPPRLCTLSPLTGPCPNQFALKLSEASQYGQHQAAIRRGGVGPDISQRFKARPFPEIVPSRLRRSGVDLANRSSRVTTNTSPFPRTAIWGASCLRSDRAPLIFS
jgi:hypothetical protein